MVKLHLPHMYMYVFVDRFKGKNNLNLFYNTPKFFQSFWDHTRLSQALRVEFVGSVPTSSRTLSAFFVALTAKHPESSAPFRQSDIIINFLTIFVPLPIMAVELNQNYKCIDYGFANEEGIRICFWNLQIVLIEFYSHYW